MTIVYNDNGITVHHADALDVLRGMSDCSVHSVVCDPQYGLSSVSSADAIAAITAWVSGNREQVPVGKGFMGNDWDAFVPPPIIWDECYRVLKPGGFLLSFAGTRMADLATLSIRLAGFKVCDEILSIGHRINWVQGQGFPKGQMLKPAHEPIVVAQRPVHGSIYSNVEEYGMGELNIGACRVPSDGSHKRAYQPTNNTREVYGTQCGFIPTNADGRYPPNVVFTHLPELDPTTGEVIGDACANSCLPGCPVLELDTQSGIQRDGIAVNRNRSTGSYQAPSCYGEYGTKAGPDVGYGGSGGASRFFPCFKWQAKAPSKERPDIDGVKHPTVKPLELIRWLVKLVTPVGGTALDWCTGSGTTGEAALIEGMEAILIEKESKYIPHILLRINEPLHPPYQAVPNQG